MTESASLEVDSWRRGCGNWPCAMFGCPVLPHVIVGIASRFPETNDVRGLDVGAHAVASLLRHSANTMDWLSRGLLINGDCSVIRSWTEDLLYDGRTL